MSVVGQGMDVGITARATLLPFSRMPDCGLVDRKGLTFNSARAISTLPCPHSRVPFVPFVTARHAAASLLNGRSHALPSARLSL